MKYKVGDKVKIHGVTDHRSKYNGIEGTIKSINPNGGSAYFSKTHYGVKGGEPYIFYETELAPAKTANNKKIVITTDGKETLARLYEDGKVVKKATAKCSPDDTFDFNVGAKLAFERLTNEKKKPLTFREKLNQEYPEKLKPSYGGGCYGCPKDYGYEEKRYCENRIEDCAQCWDRVIPENKPKRKEEPPKYYNGKVVCVERGFGCSIPLPDITVGKVYTVTDGILVANNNYKSFRYETLDGICRGLGHKFIPFVE